MPSDIATRRSRAAALIALALLPWCASAVPVTMVFTSGVAESPLGPGIPSLSGQVRLTYTFDSNLPNGSGPVPGMASYGPITAMLDFHGTSFALPIGSAITIFQLPHVYRVGGQAQNVTIDGALYSNVAFSFSLFDDDNRAFTSVALPLDTSFVSEIDRFQVSLSADGRSALGIGPPSTFTLVVPESSTAGMLAIGLVVLSALTVRRVGRRQWWSDGRKALPGLEGKTPVSLA